MYWEKKTTTALVLWLLLAIPLFFSLTVLVKQQVLQYQRNERFNKEKLRTITVLSENIYWVKPGKEILLDGKLFDVKTYKTAGNIVSLTGFFDHKEDKLVQHILKLAAQKNKSGNPLNQSAIKFMFFPAFTGPPEIAPENYCMVFSKQYFPFDEMILSAPAETLIHPPRL